MAESKDVYGHQMMAFHLNKSRDEIIEREDGLIDARGLGGKNYYFSEYKDWAPFEKESMKYVKGRVLDIGCGAGRHSLYLQKKGFDVLGIDNSPLAVKVCRLRGLRKTGVLAIEQLHRLKPGSFDSILMMGNNFGLFGNFKKARRLLRQMARITSPGARIIAQTLDPHQTKDPLHLGYHRLNRKRGRMVGQVRLRVRFQNLMGPWMDYLLVSEKEMRKILVGTGWVLNRILPSAGSLYIAVIQKH